MREIRWSIFALASIFAFGTTSTEAAYSVMEAGVTDSGTVTGRVVFDGMPPEPTLLVVDEDAEACGGDRLSDQLLVSQDGGIKNVVLTIEDIQSGKSWSFPEQFVYDQKKCTFVPHILLIQPGQAGLVTNSDSVGHNFHTISKGIFNTNKKINADGEMPIRANRIRRPGIIRVKCDIHSWMAGWWYVASSPYTVLTDEDGNFTISDIPAGTYNVKIWHETLGEAEQSVTVEANGATEIAVSLQ